MNKFNGQSMDIEQAERDKLQALFPQCFSEGKLDIDKLLNLCGEYIDNDFEKYKFEWSGKAECYRIAGKRSTGTLRPCEGESVNWDATHNLYIEGDNLEVLKLLQTAYYRKVKMIYIDPPYNTGHDFVYEDDFRDPIARYKEVTEQTTKSNPETMGRYHTNWLNMMFPRLRLAANLLRDDGVIFISIDDGEQANLRKICDEVFGEENFVANIMWQKRYSPANDHKTICPMHDFIVVYQKSSAWQRNLMPRSEENNKQYRYEDERGRFRASDYTCNKTTAERPNLNYAIINPKTGEEVWPSPNAAWRYTQERHEENVKDNLVFWGKDGNAKVPAYKRYLDELPNDGGIVPVTWWTHEFAGHNDEAAKEVGDLVGNRVFSTPKPIRLITKLLQLATNPGDEDIVLDFFSGSCATAHAAMQLNAEDGGNRRFICVQLPEVCDENSEAYKAGYKNICEIGKERIRRVGKRLLSEGVTKTTSKQDGETTRQTTLTEDGMIEEESQMEYLIQTETTKHDELDVGFRCFKLDTSNLVTWDATPIPDGDLQTLWDRFDALANTLKAGRSDMDIIFEVMLKMGVPLDYPVLPIAVNDKKAYSIGEDGLMLVCLDSGITPEDMEAMCDLAPYKIVAAEAGFVDDTALSNAHYILKDRDIEMKLL